MFEKLFRRRAYYIANAVFLLTWLGYFLILFSHPYIGLVINYEGAHWVVNDIDPYGEAYQLGITRGDQIVKINNMNPESFPSIQRWREAEGARSIVIEKTSGQQKEIIIEKPSVIETLYRELPMAILGLTFWLVGFITWFKRPFLIQARYLYWLNLVAGFTIMLGSASSRDLILARELEFISFSLVPPLLVNFVSVFPKVRKNKLNTLSTILLSSVAGLVIVILALKSMGLLEIHNELRKLVLIETVLGSAIALWNLAELIRLPDNQPEKNQAIVVLTGLAIGLLPFAILTGLPIIFNGNPVLNPRISSVFFATIPGIWGYVIVNKYLPDGRRLLELVITYLIAGVISAGLLSYGVWAMNIVTNFRPELYFHWFIIALIIFFILSSVKEAVQRITGRVMFTTQQEFRKKADELNESLKSINEEQIVGQIVKELGLEGVLIIAEDYQGWYLRKAAGRFLEDPREQEILESVYFSAKSRMEFAEFLPPEFPAEVFVPFYSDDFFCGIFLGHRCSHVKFQSWELPELTALCNQVAQRLKNSHVIGRLSREIHGMAESILESQQKSMGLRTINKSLFRNLEEEKKAVAREIHDGPLQLGLDLSRRLKQLSEDLSLNPKATHTLTSMQDLIEDLNYELRTVCTSLRPSSLSDLGLVSAVEAMCQQVMLRELLVISLDIKGVERERRFREECELGAFRFLQEGLNNVIKHSGANKVEIGIELAQANLELTIKDYGKGFDINRVEDWVVTGTHFGIIGMRERIKGLGGDFTIQSKTNQGVILRASIPIN